MFIPVVLACLATGCQFMQGLVQYSESDCQTALALILDKLTGLQAVGTCVIVHVT